MNPEHQEDMSLGNGMQVVADENYSLHPEIMRMKDEISATKKGRMIVSLAEFEDYLWLNSDELWVIQDSIADGTFSEETVDSRLSRSIVANIPSLVSFERIPEVLSFIAAGERMHVQELLADGEIHKAFLKKRRLSSILEELGMISRGEQREEYEDEAIELNMELQASSHPDLEFSSRKIHAIFSNIDIQYRRLQRSIREGNSDVSPEHSLKSLQLEYYLELSRLIDLARNHMDKNGEPSIDGAISEFLVLGRIRDRIIKRNRFGYLEASQSLLREDDTDGNHTSNDFLVPRLSKKLSKKLAFDLRVINHDTRNLARIEVKKRSANKDPKERQEEKQRLKGEYVPNIDVIAIRLGRTFHRYCDISEQYCKGRIAAISGLELTTEQIQATQIIADQVDPQITSIFAKRKLISS